MHQIGLNDTIPILPIGSRTIEELREQGKFPTAFVSSLEQIQRDLREKHRRAPEEVPDEIFIPQQTLQALLPQHLGETSDLLPEFLKSVKARKALVQKIHHTEDFTFFVDRDKAGSADVKGENGNVIDEIFTDEKGTGGLWLWDEGSQTAAYGRAQICTCSKGAKWSVTFRLQQQYPPKEVAAKFFNKLKDIALLLSDIIFANDSEEHGLVVIAGRTGSGKSQIARQLIKNYLKPRPSGRNPHLLTFETPIEEEFQAPAFGGADCTQREYPEDAKSLKIFLSDALRQTPNVVFVGETRDPRDWGQLLEFAGTGHLVITTAHAGSLVEAMSNILKETASNTPATRSIVADRLLSVVHIKSAFAATSDPPVPFLIPAIWHRTPLGIKSLMAEGLSSLLPNTPPALKQPQDDKERLPGSVGRYWFARELAVKSKFETLQEVVRIKALEWDLEGV